MSRILIMVLSCQAHHNTRQEAILNTWARSRSPQQDLLFVEGGYHDTQLTGCHLRLPCGDSYDDLAEKAFRAFEWAAANRSDCGIIKCDDDTYLHCQRLEAALQSFGHYAGSPASDQKQFLPYACGGCYWLDSRALAALVDRPFEAWSGAPWFKGNARMRRRGESHYRDSIGIEDVMVGSILHQAGIPLSTEPRFCDSPRPCLLINRKLISNHYVPPHWMREIHRLSQLPQGPVTRLKIHLSCLLKAPRRPG